MHLSGLAISDGFVSYQDTRDIEKYGLDENDWGWKKTGSKVQHNTLYKKINTGIQEDDVEGGSAYEGVMIFYSILLPHRTGAG